MYFLWFDLLQAPSKVELMRKMETEGVEKMSMYEMRRLKRLITLETVKEKNALQQATK